MTNKILDNSDMVKINPLNLELGHDSVSQSCKLEQKVYTMPFNPKMASLYSADMVSNFTWIKILRFKLND